MTVALAGEESWGYGLVVSFIKVVTLIELMACIPYLGPGFY